jgi:hypothetical protein
MYIGGMSNPPEEPMTTNTQENATMSAATSAYPTLAELQAKIKLAREEGKTYLVQGFESAMRRGHYAEAQRQRAERLGGENAALDEMRALLKNAPTGSLKAYYRELYRQRADSDDTVEARRLLTFVLLERLPRAEIIAFEDEVRDSEEEA